MEINRAAFGALAVFGVVAAGGAPNGEPSQRRGNSTAPLYAAPAASAVTETENSIATPPRPRGTAPLVAAEPAPARARRRPLRAARQLRWDEAPPASSTHTRRRSAFAGGRTGPLRHPHIRHRRHLRCAGRRSGRAAREHHGRARSGAPEPARKPYDELVIPADSVIGLQVENAVTTERAKVETRSVPG